MTFLDGPEAEDIFSKNQGPTFLIATGDKNARRTAESIVRLLKPISRSRDYLQALNCKAVFKVKL